MGGSPGGHITVPTTACTMQQQLPPLAQRNSYSKCAYRGVAVLRHRTIPEPAVTLDKMAIAGECWMATIPCNCHHWCEVASRRGQATVCTSHWQAG